MRFRVLVGRHISHKDASGKDIVVEQGGIVESDFDLCELNGKGGMQPKFERVADGETAKVLSSVSATSDPLDDMTGEELAKVAAEEEIDITDCETREDIVARIRSKV